MSWEVTPITIEGVNYCATDLYLNGPGNVATMEMLLDVGVPGGLYQHPFGSNVPPQSALVSLFPDLAFDSFAAIGFMTDGPIPFQGGAAVDIPGSSGVETFDGQNIDFAWASLGANPLPANDAFVMRLTIRRDVLRTSPFLGQFFHAGVITPFTNIPQSFFCVPEPGDSRLLGLSLWGLLALNNVKQRLPTGLGRPVKAQKKGAGSVF